MRLAGVLLMSLFLCWVGVRIVKAIQFDQHCGGNLKRAADANTVDLAKSELAVALQYVESQQLTEGYTSVLWKTPDEDLGFWYTNLKASHNELEQLSSDASPLERSNLLMKLRETLLDSGEKGVSITVPDGISIFPHNKPFFFFGIVTTLLGFIGFIFSIAPSHR